MCSYLVQVCSRLLCPALADEDSQSAGHRRTVGIGASSAREVATASGGSKAGGVLGILEELEACFPPR